MGDSGRPVDGHFRVIQTVSDTSALVQMYWYKSKPTADDPLEVEIQLELVMITDYPTDKMFDGKLYDCRDTFQVTGTVRYTTADGGSNKVWVLKPLRDKK